MIDITIDAAARLADRHAGQFAEIGNVADFESVSNSMPIRLPAAYVLPIDDSAEPIRMGNQLHTFRFGVLVIVRHVGDALGGQSMPTLGSLRDVIHGALAGWRPPNCMSVASFDRGTLIEFRQGTTVWRDDFIVRRDIAVAQPD